jgi:hypothetical protein
MATAVKQVPISQKRQIALAKFLLEPANLKTTETILTKGNAENVDLKTLNKWIDVKLFKLDVARALETEAARVGKDGKKVYETTQQAGRTALANAVENKFKGAVADLKASYPALPQGDFAVNILALAFLTKPAVFNATKQQLASEIANHKVYQAIILLKGFETAKQYGVPQTLELLKAALIQSPKPRLIV